MASVSNILAAQAQTKGDIATLAGLVTQLLQAFASGNLSPVQAQQILTEAQSEDTTIQGLSTSITSALNPPAAPAPSAS